MAENGGTTFRTAVDTGAEPVSVPVPESKSPDRPQATDREGHYVPIALYQEIEGIPYTAKYYGLEKLWNNPDLDLKDKIEAIEAYYRQKVQFKEIEDGEESFRKLIKRAEKAVGAEDSPPEVKVVKIAEWVKFMMRMDKLDYERRSEIYGKHRQE